MNINFYNLHELGMTITQNFVSKKVVNIKGVLECPDFFKLLHYEQDFTFRNIVNPIKFIAF